MTIILAHLPRLANILAPFASGAIQDAEKLFASRVIPGTSFQKALAPSQRVPLDDLRRDFTTGGFKVMGEIGLQYQGISPSDPTVDAYFALAEELDIPVAIHMGTGWLGTRQRHHAPISRLDG